MTTGAYLEKFEGYSVNTNVILHAEPSPHIVLKQCRINGLGVESFEPEDANRCGGSFVSAKYQPR